MFIYKMKTTNEFFKIAHDKYDEYIFIGDINKVFSPFNVNGSYTPLEYAITHKNQLIPMVLYHGAKFEDFDLETKRKLFNIKFDVIKHFGFKMPYEIFFETTDESLIEYGKSQGLVFEEFYIRYKEKNYSDLNIVNSKGQTLLAYAVERKNNEAIAKLLELGAPFKLIKDEVIKDEVIEDKNKKKTMTASELVSTLGIKNVSGYTIKERINNLYTNAKCVFEIGDNDAKVEIKIFDVKKCLGEETVKVNWEDAIKKANDESEQINSEQIKSESDDFEIILTDEISNAIERNDYAEILKFMKNMNDEEKINIIKHITDEKIKETIKMLSN